MNTPNPKPGLQGTNLAGMAAAAKQFEPYVKEAVAAAAAIVATADFSADAKERGGLERAIKAQKQLATLESKEIMGYYDKFVKEIEAKANRVPIEIWENLDVLQTDMSKARMVARVCYGVFAADGDMDDIEKSKFAEVCKRMRLSPAEFGLK